MGHPPYEQQRGERREDGKVVNSVREEGAQLIFSLPPQRTVRSL